MSEEPSKTPTATSPAFFVPASTPDTYERDYAGLADFARCLIPDLLVPDLADRVYSIVFIRNGEETWTVTVGEELRGVRQPKRRRPRVVLRDPAIVLAIFPFGGDSFLVVTNHWIPRGVGSEFANPFFGGELRHDVKQVVKFSPDYDVLT